MAFFEWFPHGGEVTPAKSKVIYQCVFGSGLRQVGEIPLTVNPMAGTVEIGEGCFSYDGMIGVITGGETLTFTPLDSVAKWKKVVVRAKYSRVTVTETIGGSSVEKEVDKIELVIAEGAVKNSTAAAASSQVSGTETQTVTLGTTSQATLFTFVCNSESYTLKEKAPDAGLDGTESSGAIQLRNLYPKSWLKLNDLKKDGAAYFYDRLFYEAGEALEKVDEYNNKLDDYTGQNWSAKLTALNAAVSVDTSEGYPKLTFNVGTGMSVTFCRAQNGVVYVPVIKFTKGGNTLTLNLHTKEYTTTNLSGTRKLSKQPAMFD